MIVDGANVVGSRPDGWWRDRPRAMITLVERLEDILKPLEEMPRKPATFATIAQRHSKVLEAFGGIP
jgi:hypothetical protein